MKKMVSLKELGLIQLQVQFYYLQFCIIVKLFVSTFKVIITIDKKNIQTFYLKNLRN